MPLLAESSTGPILTGIALIITAVGGIVSIVLAARRPKATSSDADAAQVWVQTFEHLDQVGAERDQAYRERDEWKARYESELSKHEACESERLELLRQLAHGGSGA